MPSKHPPISVRPGKDRPAFEAYASEHGISVGAAVLDLARIGLGRVTTPAPKAILAQAEAAAAHLGKPKPRGGRFSASTFHAGKLVPLGPTARPVGSRLKGGKR